MGGIDVVIRILITLALLVWAVPTICSTMFVQLPIVAVETVLQLHYASDDIDWMFQKSIYQMRLNKIAEVRLQTQNEVFFGSLLRIVVGEDGRILVTDCMASSVTVFDSSGRTILRIGRKGSGPGEFQYPTLAAIDRLYNIYIYDGSNLRISKFDSKGNFVRSFISTVTTHRWVLDSDGDIYLLANYFSDSVIVKVDSQGKLAARFCAQSNNFLPVANYAGGGLTMDRGGFIYQASPYEYAIKKFDANGRLLATFDKTPPLYRPMRGRPKAGGLREQSEWHRQWTHIYDLLCLDSGYLILWMGDLGGQRQDGSAGLSFCDVLDSQGRLISASIPLDSGEMSFTAKGEYIYSIREGGSDDQGNPTNPVVTKYRLR